MSVRMPSLNAIREMNRSNKNNNRAGEANITRKNPGAKREKSWG